MVVVADAVNDRFLHTVSDANRTATPALFLRATGPAGLRPYGPD
jgi:hypothetical protein